MSVPQAEWVKLSFFFLHPQPLFPCEMREFTISPRELPRPVKRTQFSFKDISILTTEKINAELPLGKWSDFLQEKCLWFIIVLQRKLFNLQTVPFNFISYLMFSFRERERDRERVMKLNRMRNSKIEQYKI